MRAEEGMGWWGLGRGSPDSKVWMLGQEDEYSGGGVEREVISSRVPGYEGQ